MKTPPRHFRNQMPQHQYLLTNTDFLLFPTSKNGQQWNYNQLRFFHTHWYRFQLSNITFPKAPHTPQLQCQPGGKQHTVTVFTIPNFPFSFEKYPLLLTTRENNSLSIKNCFKYNEHVKMNQIVANPHRHLEVFLEVWTLSPIFGVKGQKISFGGQMKSIFDHFYPSCSNPGAEQFVLRLSEWFL